MMKLEIIKELDEGVHIQDYDAPNPGGLVDQQSTCGIPVGIA